MRAQTIVFAAVCLLALLALPVASADDVVILTENNFDELVHSPNAGPWLVEFYAPWCGHCKSLEPVYNQVAEETEGKITLGKVDCTSYPALQKRFNVTGFPTIYFVREGEARMYRGDRTREAFLDYIGIVTGPPVDSLKSLGSALRNHPVMFLFLGSKQSAEYRVVETVARQLQGVVYFAESSSESIKSQLVEKSAGPVLVRLSEGADNEVYSGPFEQPRLRKWVDALSLPLLTELTGSNFIDVVSQGQIVFCITDITKDSSEQYQGACRDMAKQMKGKFIFAHLDGLKYDKYLSQFGLAPVNYPMIMVFDYANEQYYIPQFSLQTSSQVREYLMSVYEGRIKPQTMGAWWSPVRIYRWFEKWIVQFSEIQVLIGSIVATAITAALIWWTCCTGGDPSGDDDEDVPVEEEKESEENKGGKKKGGRGKPAKRGAAPAVEEDTSDTETSGSKKKDQ